MLIAYLDEFGHIGPFVSQEHAKYNDHPAFGYAGFVLPVDSVRSFGGFFEYIKENLLDFEIKRAGAHPRRWEKKGSSLLTTANHSKYKAEIVPALSRLHARLRKEGGRPVYFGQVKQQGVPTEVAETSADRSGHLLINAVRNLARYADSLDERIMIFLDAVDNAPRLEAVQRIGGYIYKAAEPELRRVVEVPMQLESKHYGNVQFADWIAAIVSRASHFHLVPSSEFGWAPSVAAKTIGAGKCDVGSYIKASSDVADRRKLHSNTLCSDHAWIANVTARKTSVRQREPRALTQTIGASSPGLAAFYNTLKASG